MTAEYRTEVVSISNRRGGKSKIHRASCRFVKTADAFYIRPVRTGDVSHRIYTVCGTCLAGMSTFRLPAEPVDVEPVMAACGRVDPHRAHAIYAGRLCAGNLDIVTERTSAS